MKKKIFTGCVFIFIILIALSTGCSSGENPEAGASDAMPEKSIFDSFDWETSNSFIK